MKKGCWVALAVVVVLLLLVALAGWGAWRATGRGLAIHRSLGGFFLEIELPKAAAKSYRKALDISPDDPGLHVQLAVALAQRGQVAEALDHIDEAKNLDPASPAAHLAEGRLSHEEGAIPEAEAAYARAAAVAPDDPYVHLGTGVFFAQEADWDKAEEALERAIELDQNLQAPYEWLGHVRERQGDADGAIPAYEAGANRGSQYCHMRLRSLGQSGGSPAPVGGTQSAPPPFMFGFLGIFMVFYGAMILFFLAMWVASVFAIYDCARRDFDDPATRALWCILIVLVQWIGAIIYYFLVYRKNDPPRQLRRTP